MCVCVCVCVSVAQWLEQSAVNRKVGGSNPSRDVFFITTIVVVIKFDLLIYLHKLHIIKILIYANIYYHRTVIVINSPIW